MKTSLRTRRTRSSFVYACGILASLAALQACGDSDDDGGGGSGGSGTGGDDDGTGGRATGGRNNNGTGGRATGGSDTGTGGRATGGSDNGSGGNATGGVGTGGLGGQVNMGGAPISDRCDPEDADLELPPGFCAQRVAQDLGLARHLAVTPSGDVFVAVNPGPGGSGEIVALRDTDDDGELDMRATFNTTGGNGIAWHDGFLYFAEHDRILRYELPDGELMPSAAPEVVVSGLPDDGDHPYKTIVLSDDETMFVNIGSATNSCQQNNRQLESPGINPCAELDVRAGIWQFDPSELDQQAEDGERYAAGTRNANALAIQPDTADLWAVTNGRDQLNENWPNLYTAADEQRLPSERLLRVEAGEHYGWPYCYHDPDLGMVLAPEYGGDGETVGACDEYPEPDFTLPAHWAPLGAVFYEGEQFPERYAGGLFIAFHGSRFAPNAMGDLPGYQVGFLPFDGDMPDDELETFASGFAGPDRPLPAEADARPIGVAVADDGSLYISDDHGGNLFRVYFVGE